MTDKNRKWKQPHQNPGQRASQGILRRTMVITLLVALAFVPLIWTLFQLMILDHDKYEQMAIANQTRSTSLSAERGVIYDRNMNILAKSVTVENVFIDPNQIATEQQNLNLIATGLAEILDVEESFVYEQAADTKMRYKVIRRKIDADLAQEVRDFINENEIKGIYLEPDTKRSYPYGTLCAQVLGFTREDNVGAEGIEAYYDSYLQGTAGEIITTKGNLGTEMLYNYEKYYDASDGNSLVLTIDATVQYYLEKNLQTAIEKYDVLNGAFGIVADVNTGEILGMATMGTYDPNNYLEIYDEDTVAELEEIYQAAQGYRQGSAEYEEAMDAYNDALASARLAQWRNRAVSDGYEPGSTFKLITLASALEEGAVTLDDTFYCDGAEYFEGRSEILDCWKHEGHGLQTTGKALENSCNIAFANIGLALGGTNLYDYIRDFGLLSKTGIDLPGEGVGFFYSREKLKPVGDGISNTISSSFGQTFKITPIQLVRAISAVVNGGYVLEPYVVSEVLDDEGNLVEKNERTVIRQVISEETSKIMCGLMCDVVETGTAQNAQVAGYSIGGKTGTSEKIDVFDENGVRVEDKIVSFVGVGPIDDPQYVVLVALDTPSTATGLYISGGIMAAPTVRDVFTDILPYLGVEPNYNDDDIERIAVTVPNVRNMTESDAAENLKKRSLTYRTVGDGDTVTDMIPAAGSEVPGTSEIILYMGEEKPTDLVTVPDFTGLTVAQANDTAAYRGLYILAKGTDQNNNAVSVTYQDVEAGAEVPRGTTVTVEFTNHSAQD
ncbi:MAG TPA: PASTA domain-containing protein [Candidatus Avoscillospira avistercoris]|uniref:PASTA domain-containing protein n=1 Tax=Candidatus Avoscillospira avistercoris TaxID=2840707 RepID=A0A9D1FBC7_9FIRM|nr:PASTA domain-containing protein [Candidatus Avoscillospira avistercoris]